MVSMWVVSWDSETGRGRTGRRFHTEREAWDAYRQAKRNGRNPEEPYLVSFDGFL